MPKFERVKPPGESPEYSALIERRRQQMYMYLKGRSQAEIAKKFGISQKTVSEDLDKIRQVWLDDMLIPFTSAKAREIARIDMMELEAWAAWDRSCQPIEDMVEVEERMPKKAPQAAEDEGTVQGTFTQRIGKKAQVASTASTASKDVELVITKSRTSKTRRSQVGDPRFLQQIAWCIETRLKIMGVYQDIQLNFQVGGGSKAPGSTGIDWDRLYTRVEITDPAAPRIAALEEGKGNGAD